MKVLIYAVDNYIGTAYLPREFKKADCEVSIAMRNGSFISHTRFYDHKYPLAPQLDHSARVLECREIIEKDQPDLLVPGDDFSRMLLHLIYEYPQKFGASEKTRDLIVRSLGNPKFFPILEDKFEVSKIATDLGVPTPKYKLVSTVADALEFAESNPFPLLLKPAVGTGGKGIQIFQDEDSLVNVIRTLTGRWLLCEYIKGAAANCCFVSKDGVLLQAVVTKKIYALNNNLGPGTVMQPVDNPVIRESVIKLVDHFGVNGFLSFGWMIDEQERPFLLELNSRAVSMTTGVKMLGGEFVQAWIDATGGQIAEPRWFTGSKIALFPQERKRNPGYVPSDDCLEYIPDDDPKLCEVFWAYANAH